MRTKLLLISIAALSLATGTAQATSYWITVCGNKLIYIHGHHGETYYQWIGDKEWELPSKLFTERGNRLYFRGRKCQPPSMLRAPAIEGEPRGCDEEGKCK
jgi:hypothetical protein